MFRPIHIDSSQVLCACQGPFNLEWKIAANSLWLQKKKKIVKKKL